jgi:hypothetical protein
LPVLPPKETETTISLSHIAYLSMHPSPKLAHNFSSTARATFFDEIDPHSERNPNRSSLVKPTTTMPSPSITSSPYAVSSNAGISLRKELRSPAKETVMSHGQALSESGGCSSELFRPTLTLQPPSDSAFDARRHVLLLDFIPANTSRSKIRGFFLNQLHGRGANPSKIEILAFAVSGRARSARVEFSTHDELMQALSDCQETPPNIFVYVVPETIEEVRLQLRGLESDVRKQLGHMSALKDRGDWRSCIAAIAVLEATLTPAHYHIAMQACELTQKGDVADALLHCMEERKVQIEQKTIQACIRACCSSGCWEKAAKHLDSILHHASIYNATIEPAVFDLMCSCLGFAGQWERALEVVGMKNANDARILRSSLIDEWRTFKQQNEDVFEFCRAALATRSGFPDAFRELIDTQRAMASEFIHYCRDFEELAALSIAQQHEFNVRRNEEATTDKE